MSAQDISDENVGQTDEGNESNSQASESENEEADNYQGGQESGDNVADLTDDQDSSFTPKGDDLKSLDGSEISSDEDNAHDAGFNVIEESDASTDFEGVTLTSAHMRAKNRFPSPRQNKQILNSVKPLQDSTLTKMVNLEWHEMHYILTHCPPCQAQCYATRVT